MLHNLFLIFLLSIFTPSTPISTQTMSGTMWTHQYADKEKGGQTSTYYMYFKDEQHLLLTDNLEEMSQDDAYTPYTIEDNRIKVSAPMQEGITLDMIFSVAMSNNSLSITLFDIYFSGPSVSLLPQDEIPAILGEIKQSFDEELKGQWNYRE